MEDMTRKIKSVFNMKDMNLRPSCKIYKVKCTCGETYVGKTIRNVEVRRDEHKNANKKSEPLNYLFFNLGLNFK